MGNILSGETADMLDLLAYTSAYLNQRISKSRLLSHRHFLFADLKCLLLCAVSTLYSFQQYTEWLQDVYKTQ